MGRVFIQELQEKTRLLEENTNDINKYNAHLEKDADNISESLDYCNILFSERLEVVRERTIFGENEQQIQKISNRTGKIEKQLVQSEKLIKNAKEVSALTREAMQQGRRLNEELDIMLKQSKLWLTYQEAQEHIILGLFRATCVGGIVLSVVIFGEKCLGYCMNACSNQKRKFYLLF